MCDPVSITTLAVSAVSTLYAADQQRKAQHQAADEYRQNQALQDQAIQNQQTQINAQASDEMQARARQAMIEQARIRAIAASSGVAGASVDAATRESDFNKTQDIAQIENNRSAQMQQSVYAGQQGYLQSNARIQSLTGPSNIGVGLQIAGDAASAYAYHEKITPKSPTT